MFGEIPFLKILKNTVQSVANSKEKETVRRILCAGNGAIFIKPLVCNF